MPEGIVDELEVVEVDVKQRAIRLAGAPYTLHHPFQFALEITPVIQAGETVALGHGLEALHHSLTFADIGEQGDIKFLSLKRNAAELERHGKHGAVLVPSGHLALVPDDLADFVAQEMLQV